MSPQNNSETLTASVVSSDTDSAPAMLASGALVSTGKKELNGPKRLEPTRYGDWEKNGRCIDF